MKTQYYTATTLNGFIATDDDSLEWLFTLGNIGESSYPEFIADVGALAMGASTYEWMLRHADEVAAEVGSPWPYTQPVWIFTHRELPSVEGADIRFVQGDVAPIHAEMKVAAGGKNIWVVGGGDLAGQFYDAGLLDELIVQIGSATLGSGKPLFPRTALYPSMRLTSSRPMGDGMIELRYACKRATDPFIRKAVGADAKALAELAERTFRDTFASMNTVDDMEQHCRQSYSEELQYAEISNPAMITLVCEHGGQLIAFAQLRWTDAPQCVDAERPGEIQRFYVAQEWHGMGIAQDLMDSCIQELQKHNTDVVWLGVWERNPRAISFYRNRGFTEVGSHVFQLGSDQQRDVVMARTLRVGSPQVNLAIPILLSRSIPATQEFYARLGFTGRADDAYAVLRRGPLELHFSLHAELVPERSDTMCYLRVENVDALYHELSAAQLPHSGIPRIDVLSDKPWGMREFAIVDEDGNLLRIGQAI